MQSKRIYETSFKIVLLCVVLVASLASDLAVAGSEDLKIRFPVEKFQLQNGLTVLLHQDRTVPMVSYHTWYRVGSRDEKPGVTGAAHMLEHMMFKGAKKYSGKQFDRILHENGITNNAFTSWDYTGFYENLPSSKIELIMDMEVDRMRDLTIAEEDLISELEVVKEERRWRIDNNPPSLLREKMMEALFRVHPYRWPVIGTMEDIAAYTPEKLRHFYKAFYGPNNAILVIAGDIDVPKVRGLVEKYYGALPKRDVPKQEYQAEPEATRAQRIESEAEVQSSTVMLAYKSVAVNHPDSFALDLAASIIADGKSSRLYKRLVYKDQIATGTAGYNVTNADPGYFSLLAQLKPGQKTAQVEKALRSEALRLTRHPVGEKELQKVKNQLMKNFVDGLTTIDGKARALAVNEILFGTYEKLFSDLELYRKVTVADIQRVAKTYFKNEREVIAVLNPKAKGSAK